MDKKNVCVIGGAIMDIMGFPDGELAPRDSTPGRLRIAPGGVGRNIAENLARLGVPTCLVTAFGDDFFARLMIREAGEVGIDVTHSRILPGQTTAMHLAIQDARNDLAFGIAAMDVLQQIDVDLLRKSWPAVCQAGIVVLETNTPASTIDFLVRQPIGGLLFLDPVSVPMCAKIKNQIGRFHTIKPNQQEAELLSGLHIRTEADMQQAASVFHEKGVRRIFLTLGEAGVFFSDGRHAGWMRPQAVKPVNTTGAGDAFMAGLVFASRQQLPVEECARIASHCAAIAVRHEYAVNPEMNERLLKEFSRMIGG